MGGAMADTENDGPAKVVGQHFGSSLMSVFMHADSVDLTLMVLGLVGAIGDGVWMPVMLLIISRIFNDIGSGPNLVQGFSSKINEVCTHISMHSNFLFTRLLGRITIY
jgi:ATP-binding cassette subfamily B (MDR/TAP) protein 1